MSDLVSRLLEAIEAREQKALKASPGPWHANAEHDEVLAVDDETVCEGFALSNNQLRNTVDFIVDNDPSSVLRRCEAERKTVLAYKGVDDAKGEMGPVDLHPIDKGKWIGLRIAVNGIAASYGITEEET